MVNALAAHVAQFGLGPTELIFTNAQGRPLWRTTYADNWRRVARPLGVPLRDGYHQLRHFYASALIRSGESVKVVQERLGHTSAQMTLDIYSHLWPEDEDRTRSAIDGLLGAQPREIETAAAGDLCQGGVILLPEGIRKCWSEA